MRRLPLLLLLLVASPGRSDGDATPPAPPAPSPSQPWSARWNGSCNRHRVGGADNDHNDSSVTLERLAGGKVRVEDRGENRQGHLDQTWGYREEKVTWSNVWLGTLVEKAGALTLDLELSRRECRRVLVDRGAETKPPCAELKKHQRLTCSRIKLELDRKEQRDVWSCLPDESGSGGGRVGSPLPWLLDPEICVQINGCQMMHPVHHGRCGKP
jgi:hypothetical protein